MALAMYLQRAVEKDTELVVFPVSLFVPPKFSMKAELLASEPQPEPQQMRDVVMAAPTGRRPECRLICRTPFFARSSMAAWKSGNVTSSLPRFG